MHQIIESAASCGRSLQSPQTGFVHHCYSAGDEGVRDTIPLYENFLFALTLFRTKISTSVQEARDLITKLLHFKVEGNFPVYIHEYPKCRDRYLFAQILPPLYWILKRFFLVLGDEFRQTLNEVAKELLESAKKEKEAPFQIAIKMAAALKAFGELWQQTELIIEGDKWLEELLEQSKKDDFGSWYSPTYIGETFIALQMVYPDLKNSPWKHFWDYVVKTWNSQAFAYTGPAVQERQWSFEPQPTVYDLFLGTYTHSYSYRFYNDHPVQLVGACVQTERKELLEQKFPITLDGSVASHKWSLTQTKNYSCALLEKQMMLDPAMQKGYHVYKQIWGDENNTHSLISQGEGATQVHFHQNGNTTELIFTLAQEIDFNDRKKNREVTFFLDRSQKNTFLVNGEKSNTFKLGDTLSVHSGGLKTELKFELIEGDGKFFGHIMPANRPAQLNYKGENRFETFDWSLFLRTIKRYGPCKIKATIIYPE